MGPNPPSSPMELPSSPPTQKSFNLKHVARLSDSIWCSKRATKEKSPISTNNIFSKIAEEDSLSSDPITAQNFEPKNTKDNIYQKKSNKRKSPDSTPPTINSRKIIQIEEPKITKQHTFLSAIQEARNLLVKAYSLTETIEKQDAVLDLVEIFRNYIEEGRVRPISINKPTASPSELSPTNEVPAVPEPTLPSYAQMLRRNVPILPPATAQNPANGMKVLHKLTRQAAPAVCPTETIIQNIVPKSSPIQITTTLPRENVVTLVTKQGEILPTYDAFSIRERINKILGKRAISRVHTSVKGNLVLTCMDSPPSELLLDQEKWETIFAGWPINKVQKVSHWLKLVVHGVPTSIPINAINEEIEIFNEGTKTQGQPRWLSKSYQQRLRASITFSVTSEEERDNLIKSGVLIGGLRLKVVSFQQSTQKTQCLKCLSFGHHQIGCTKDPICAICLGKHITTAHKCSACSATQSCTHHAVQCANCKSNTHLAFQRQDCDYFKALSC